MLDIQAATAAEQAQLQQTQQEAAVSLRHMIAGAAGCSKPVLSDAAQAFLGNPGTHVCHCVVVTAVQPLQRDHRDWATA